MHRCERFRQTWAQLVSQIQRYLRDLTASPQWLYHQARMSRLGLRCESPLHPRCLCPILPRNRRMAKDLCHRNIECHRNFVNKPPKRVILRIRCRDVSLTIIVGLVQRQRLAHQFHTNAIDIGRIATRNRLAHLAPVFPWRIKTSKLLELDWRAPHFCYTARLDRPHLPSLLM